MEPTLLSKKQRNVLVLLMLSGTAINTIDRIGLSTAAPVVIKDLHLTPALMGVAFSAFFWPYVLMQIPTGSLADRFGSKIVLGWAAALWSVASACTACVTNLVSLAVTRIFLGIGESAWFPVNVKVINNYFPKEERGVANGLSNGGIRLGSAIAPLLMVALIQRVGWRYAFLITGLGSLIWCIFWYFGFKPGERRSGSSRDKYDSFALKALLAKRATIGIVLTKFFNDYLYYLLLTWIPTYLVMEKGFSLMKMGIYAAFPWFFGFIAEPIVGGLSDWLIKKGWSVTLSRKSCVIAVQLISGIATMSVGFVAGSLPMVITLTVAIAFQAAAGSMTWTLCTEVAPKASAGLMGGIMNTGGAVAGILSPLITGFIFTATGSFQWALVIGGGAVLLASASVIFVLGELIPISLADRVAVPKVAAV
jgi:ACS family glucarate transporter-like MFS transporter